MILLPSYLRMDRNYKRAIALLEKLPLEDPGYLESQTLLAT